MAKSKTQRKSSINKLYREFTRVKYQKYRNQFPRAKESEIIAKILKEWNAMDEEAKDVLQNQFVHRVGTSFLDDSSSSSKDRVKK